MEKRVIERFSDTFLRKIVTLGACFMLQVHFSGCLGTLGIILVEYSAYFEVSKGVTSWIPAIQMSCVGLSGILFGPLAQRYGNRKVCLLGAVSMFLGHILSAFAPNIFMLYFTYGILTGIGYGGIVITSLLAPQQCFPKHRALVTAVIMIAVNVGTLFQPILAEYLVRQYGVRGWMIITAGIHLHVLVWGALLFPLEQDVRKSNPDEALLNGEATDVENITPQHQDMDKNVYLKEHSNQENTNQSVTMSPGMDNHELYKEIAMPETEYKEIAMSETEYRNEKEEKLNSNNSTTQKKKFSFDFTLFKNIPFTVVTIGICLLHFQHMTPFAFIPNKTINSGMTEQQGATLVSIPMFPNMISRLIAGFVLDRVKDYNLHVLGVTSGLASLIITGAGFIDGYNELAVTMVFYGLLAGIYALLFVTVLADLVGMEKLPQATGLFLMMLGVTQLICLSFPGWLLDVTGDANIPFIVNGLISFPGAVMILVVAVVRMKHARQKKKISDSVIT